MMLESADPTTQPDRVSWGPCPRRGDLGGSVVDVDLLDRDAGGGHAQRPDLQRLRPAARTEHDPTVEAARLGLPGGPVHTARERSGHVELAGLAHRLHATGLHATRNGGVLLGGRLVVGTGHGPVTRAAVHVVRDPVDRAEGAVLAV